MKRTKNATSVIESMVILMIVVIGITGAYSLFNTSFHLQETTAKRIEAIQIARDGLEAFTNIRNTNWLLFSSDYSNCWVTLNYDSNCIGFTGHTYDMRHSAGNGMTINRLSDNRFYMGIHSSSSSGYLDAGYRSRFQVQKDARGFYTQSGGNFYGTGGIPFFTREINLMYISGTGVEIGSPNSNQPMVRVTSKVQWVDPSKNSPYSLELSTILTNWKKVY